MCASTLPVHSGAALAVPRARTPRNTWNLTSPLVLTIEKTEARKEEHRRASRVPEAESRRPGRTGLGLCEQSLWGSRPELCPV